MYLLDANAISDISRRPHGPVAERVRVTPPEQLCTSIIVAAEIRFGLERGVPASLAHQVEQILGGVRIVPFEQPADQVYAELRADLYRRGLLIGANDLFIAAHALALDCTLVTDNMREFERVPGLRIENWRRT